MLFMLSFIASLVFGWYAKKYGFASMWISLFNLLISIYLGIMLTPTVVGFLPAFAEVYYKVICSLVITVIIFIILKSIVYFYLDHALDAVMPELFSRIAGGVTGFFMMLIILNFLIFNGFAIASNIVESEEMQANTDFKKSSSMVLSSCKLIHGLAGQPKYDAPMEIIEWYKYNPEEKKDAEKSEDKKETEKEKV